MSGLSENIAAGGYELDAEGQTVFATCRRSEDVLTILWVEAPLALRGTGAAGRLMSLLCEEARRRGWRIAPSCGYAAAWLRGSKQYRDLMA